MTRGIVGLLAPVAAVAVAACSPGYDHLDFTAQTTPPIAVTLTPTELTIPIGIAVGVVAQPVDSDGKPLGDDQAVELVPRDPILGADPSTLPKGFVLYGIKEGTTLVDVFVHGDAKGTLSARVPPQR